MMEKERVHQVGSVSEEICVCIPIENGKTLEQDSYYDMDKDAGTATCRVCQCAEPDRRGAIALAFLGISPPPYNLSNGHGEMKSNLAVASGNAENNSLSRSDIKEFELTESISRKGEVFICISDLEPGCNDSQDRLFELGCSCKNDLALAHYGCALKWFINHGSTVCEICGSVAKNVRPDDFKTVLCSLKEYEALKEGIVYGEANNAPCETSFGLDTGVAAVIRRQRLSEISLWFNPRNNSNNVTRVVSEQRPAASFIEGVAPVENTATKWAVEGTGILLATGLLTVTLAWFLAPYFGKKTAKSGLHVLLGGVCALIVVVLFRFCLLTRIKYGAARYWAILFVFWFLVFGIWASRAHAAA